VSFPNIKSTSVRGTELALVLVWCMSSLGCGADIVPDEPATRSCPAVCSASATEMCRVSVQYPEDKVVERQLRVYFDGELWSSELLDTYQHERRGTSWRWIDPDRQIAFVIPIFSEYEMLGQKDLAQTHGREAGAIIWPEADVAFRFPVGRFETRLNWAHRPKGWTQGNPIDTTQEGPIENFYDTSTAQITFEPASELPVGYGLAIADPDEPAPLWLHWTHPTNWITERYPNDEVLPGVYDVYATPVDEPITYFTTLDRPLKLIAEDVRLEPNVESSFTITREDVLDAPELDRRVGTEPNYEDFVIIEVEAFGVHDLKPYYEFIDESGQIVHASDSRRNSVRGAGYVLRRAAFDRGLIGQRLDIYMDGYEVGCVFLDP